MKGPARPLRMLLVEDSENDALLLLREFRRGGYEPVYERVSTPEEMERALEEASKKKSPWQIVISDYYMPRFRAPDALPDGDGLELIEDLSSNEPQIMTLVLSASLESGRFARAIEAGAGGVLHKSTPIKDIIEAVRRLEAGEALLSPGEVIEMLRLVSREREEKREVLQAIEKLTAREKEILRSLAEGLESREIAEKLNITVETERTHMVNILHKLGVHSRLQALVFAARHGLVEIR
jgi:DNA-binding NarL/FixJ family response regulator